MKRTVPVCSILILVAITIGCAAGPGEEQPSVSGPSVTSVLKQDDLTVSLTANPRVLESGKGLPLTLSIRNLSKKPRTFDLTSGQTYEFIAYEKNRDEVWRWSSGMMFIQIMRSETIEAGGNKVYRVSWPTAGIKPGAYTVNGYFLGLPDLKPGVEIEIKAVE